MTDKLQKINDLYYTWTEATRKRYDLQFAISESTLPTSYDVLDEFVKLVRVEAHAREAYFAELKKDIRVRASTLWEKITKRKK